MVHIVGSISGPHHFPIKIVVSEGLFLLAKFSERGAKFSSLSGVVQKQAFQKRGW